MAKASGSTRVSKWRPSGASVTADLYYFNGARREYNELPDDKKNAIKKEKADISRALYAKLKNTVTPQVIDEGKPVEIHYTSRGLDHFANDAMLTLSGKYFSRSSMMRVNEILEKSTYVPTPHELTHPRTDGRDLWFSYTDSEGRGVYFKVAWNNKMKIHELYSVKDRL